MLDCKFPLMILALWLSSAALAQEEESGSTFPVTFSEELVVRYWQKPGRLATTDGERAIDDYLEQMNRLVANGTAGPWTFGVQVDEVSLYGTKYELCDEEITDPLLLDPDRMNSPWPTFDGADVQAYANIEKLTAKYASDSLDLALGDFYAAFGRGAALNVNRNVDIDIDTSIQGARAQWRPGAWDVTALVGQINRQQVRMSNPNLEMEGDRRHTVAGVRAERYGLGPANVGVHAVSWSIAENYGLGPGFANMGTTPDQVVGGVTAEIFGLAGVDWFLEADVFAHPTDQLLHDPEDDLGFAGYASAAFYPGSTVWLCEAKWYEDAERVNSGRGEQFELATAPTLEYERAATVDSQHGINSQDIYGGRCKVDVPVADGIVPYASMAAFRDDDLEEHSNPTAESILHPMLGMELTVDHWAVLVNAGYRAEIRDEGDAGEDWGADKEVHADADFKFPLGHGGLIGNLTSSFVVFDAGPNPLSAGDDGWERVESAVSLQKGSDIALIGYLDYTTEAYAIADLPGNVNDNVYVGGELMVKPTSALTMKAFYGAQKGGLKCAGGQCRNIPGFRGARFTMVGTF